MPGDLILHVNGSEFAEEQLQNLASWIANSDHMEFEIGRGGGADAADCSCPLKTHQPPAAIAGIRGHR